MVRHRGAGDLLGCVGSQQQLIDEGAETGPRATTQPGLGERGGHERGG